MEKLKYIKHFDLNFSYLHKDPDSNFLQNIFQYSINIYTLKISITNNDLEKTPHVEHLAIGLNKF